VFLREKGQVKKSIISMQLDSCAEDYISNPIGEHHKRKLQAHLLIFMRAIAFKESATTDSSESIKAVTGCPV
jgi:hypothetical protein